MALIVWVPTPLDYSVPCLLPEGSWDEALPHPIKGKDIKDGWIVLIILITGFVV